MLFSKDVKEAQNYIFIKRQKMEDRKGRECFGHSSSYLLPSVLLSLAAL